MSGDRGRVSPHPGIIPLEAVHAQEIPALPHPDWIIAADRLVWVAGVDGGVAVYEPLSGRRLASIPIAGDLCGAPDAGFGSVWYPTCRPAAIHEVSIATRRLIASIPIEVPPAGEFSIGAGEDGIWAIVERGQGRSGLGRIDPDGRRLADVFDIPQGGISVRAGRGSLWIAYAAEDRLLRVEPTTGAVVSDLATGRGPRFLALGEEGVWVLNQTSGSVTHIDPVSDEVVATIAVDDAPMRGGDIAIGDGSIWVRGTTELVAQIDPRTDTVVARYGAPSSGSASVAAVEGQLWISAGAEGLLYRIDVAGQESG